MIMDILETEDGKWDGVIRAFWRRIQGYKKCEFNDIKELPDPLPVEFRAHFATALLASPIKGMTETAKEASNRAIADHNEIQTLRAKAASADVLVEALRMFVDDAISVDVGGGDYVGTTCESLEIATEALATYDKLSEVKHDTK